MLSCAGCIRGLELAQVYHEESEILFFSCSAINRLAEWKYIWKSCFSAVLRGFFTPIPTHTHRKNAQKYDVPDEETLITILIAKLLGKWLLNGSSALGSVTDQLHVNKDIFICISVPVWKIATVVASTWCTPEDAVWVQTITQRSSCPDGSSFYSDSNHLHGSGHLLIPLVQKSEKTAYKCERETGFFCSLLVRRSVQDQQGPVSLELVTWAMLIFQSQHHQMWHQGLAAECAGAPWLEKAHVGWVCLHQLLWTQSLQRWPEVMLDCLMSGIS